MPLPLFRGAHWLRCVFEYIISNIDAGIVGISKQAGVVGKFGDIYVGYNVELMSKK